MVLRRAAELGELEQRGELRRGEAGAGGGLLLEQGGVALMRAAQEMADGLLEPVGSGGPGALFLRRLRHAVRGISQRLIAVRRGDVNPCAKAVIAPRRAFP
jgi:hypothetical protein